MYGVVKVGEIDVPMLALASTDIYYKRIFRIDPFKLQSSKDYDTADAIQHFMRVGYVMAMQAAKPNSEVLKLTEDSYIEWLEGFDRSAYMQAVPMIQKVYEGNLETGSTQKNADAQ